jgi:hypothetical protein
MKDCQTCVQGKKGGKGVCGEGEIMREEGIRFGKALPFGEEVGAGVYDMRCNLSEKAGRKTLGCKCYDEQPHPGLPWCLKSW